MQNKVSLAKNHLISTFVLSVLISYANEFKVFGCCKYPQRKRVVFKMVDKIIYKVFVLKVTYFLPKVHLVSPQPVQQKQKRISELFSFERLRVLLLSISLTLKVYRQKIFCRHE